MVPVEGPRVNCRTKPSVVVLSGSHLCHNPRVMKEATALSQAGFDVEVLGAWLDASLKEQDRELLARVPFRFTPVLDFAERDVVAQIQRKVCQLRGKVGQLAYRIGWLPNRWQLGYAISALAQAARKRKANLFIAHSEAALVVARDLLNAGCRVGVDMEDWFSEDLLPEARKNRPIRLLRDLERQVLQQGSHSTCPSQSMSDALTRTYGCSPPAVIFNAFPWADRKSLDHPLKERKDRRMPSIHWYSQTVGHGRGLEDLLAALPRLKHQAEIHLRGNPVVGFDHWLAARVPEDWRNRVFVHGLVSNEELLSRISEHDIGFAGEMKYCKSRDLTITNKILHYLLAGLAVVASDTAGQREVAERAPGAVFLYPCGDATALAAQLDALLETPEKLKHSKAAALRAAKQTFCWEQQEKVLLQSIMRAVGAPAQ